MGSGGSKREGSSGATPMGSVGDAHEAGERESSGGARGRGEGQTRGGGSGADSGDSFAPGTADGSIAPREPALHNAVLATAIHLIVTIDSTGEIQSASDAVHRVFGWTPGELIGRNVSILMPEPHRSAHDGHLARYLKTGQSEHLNRARLFEAMRRDGTFLPIEVSVSRVDVPGKRTPLFVGVMRDMSERGDGRAEGGAGAQDELFAGEEDTRRIHDLLAEQTAALHSAHLRLRMTDRMASIGMLAAGLGHDMHNVLLPVQGHLNAARAEAMSASIREHIGAVQRGVTYLQQLADGLHLLTIDSDNDGSESASVDLRAWWSQAGSLLRKGVPKHVRVSASFAAGLPEVGISGHGLTQAVLNLVVNAGQAIPDPSESAGQKPALGRVRIWAELIDRGARVRLGVTDNGAGMSAETQRNAFEMFYTTKTRGLGTGLGLPLVARVIARAGGEVHIESEPGQGTTVEMLLPVADAGQQRPRDLDAVVTLGDGRSATLIGHLIESAGVRATLGGDPAGAQIWILEPTRARLDDAGAWRKRHAGGGLVLFGEPSGSVRAWEALDPVIVRDCDDLDAIRAALGRVLADM